ncbi:MAG: response regulator [Paracoccaceae bacterium]
MGNRILLIEDEPNIIEAVRFILSQEGYVVDTHSDGATALQEIQRRNPDVVILDVMLPNQSGYDVLRDLRMSETDHETPVIMLTARGQKKDREQAALYGANRFMTKPFSNSEVLSTVRELAQE